MIMTWVLIGLTVLFSLAAMVPMAAVAIGYIPADGYQLALWRPFTYTLWAQVPWGLLNLLVLWMVGRTLEPSFGRWRFLAVFVLSGLGGALTLHLFAGSIGALFPGSALACLGIIAASSATKLRTGEDLRPDLGLLGLMVLANVVLNWSSRYWIGLLGAILFAGVATLVIVFASGPRRDRLQALGLIGMGVVGLAGLFAPSLL